jgi:hypothetical protein
MKLPGLAPCFILALSVASAAQEQAAAAELQRAIAQETWRTRGGETTWWLNEDALRALAIRPIRQGASTNQASSPYLELHYAAEPATGFSLRVRGDVFNRLEAADVRHRGGPVLALPEGELDLRGFRLLRRSGSAFGLDVADANGTVWFRLDHAHQYFDRGAGSFAVRYMDLRIAAALARRLGRPEFDGLLVGGMQTAATAFGREPALTTAPASFPFECTAPWPTPGEPDAAPWVDVRMLHLLSNYEDDTIDGVNSYRCGRDDGSGHHTLACTRDSDDGLVVLSPDASLRNDGTAGAAWTPKFSAPRAPYANDQHPFLVWNLYRIDADGSLQQIGVSALKHAFHTINYNCGCEQGEVLYPRCEDTYGGFSNDYPAALAPRSEVIPHTAQWGRCGSLYDKDCDGAADADNGVVPDDGYSVKKRMAVREAELSATLHPGARWFIEYWYVVRDDIDPYNNIGLLEITPHKMAGQGADPDAWIWKFDGGEFRNGPMVDRWAQLAPVGTYAQVHEQVTASGRIRVASRASPLADGRWRYDWAVFNLDYSRALTSGSEPNLRILSNRGLIGVSVPFDANAALGSTLFAGIGAGNGAAWGREREGSRLVWSAPADNPLDWGRTNVYTLITDAAPSPGAITFDDGLASTRAPGVEALVPLSAPAPRRRTETLGDHAPH